MEVLPGVHMVPGVVAHVYLIVRADGLTVVDCGMRATPAKILATVRALGYAATDVRHILLTHQHMDHIGGAAALARATRAAVYAHPLDAPAIAGNAPREAPHGPLGAVFRVAIFPRLAPVTVTHELHDGETLPILASDGGVQVVATPGHTAGHVSFYVPGRRLLFAGDACMHRGGRLALPPGFLNHDSAEARRSLARLAQLAVDACLPGHGPPLRTGAGPLLARALRD